MVTAEIRKIIKDNLGKHYSNEILKILNKQGLTNRDGNEFSLSHIRQVFNGQKENIFIGAAIKELADTIKAALKKARAASSNLA